MHIRDFASDDSKELASLFRRAVREIGARDYNAAQIDAWADGISAENLDARLSDGRLALVAVGEDGKLLAFGDLEASGHLDFLYALPEAAGKGIAARLYETLETRARAKAITRLYTEASEPARRFFLKTGFVVLRRRDFMIGTTPIHYYAMEKLL